jgi:hypothetical protein
VMVHSSANVISYSFTVSDFHRLLVACISGHWGRPAA